MSNDNGDADPGQSEEAVFRATGKGWQEWMAILDDLGAGEWPHEKIAAWITASFEAGSWQSQLVASRHLPISIYSC
jgi:hypothetical protein